MSFSFGSLFIRTDEKVQSPTLRTMAIVSKFGLSDKATLAMAAAGLVLGICAVGIFLIQHWPPIFLDLSTAEKDALPVEARLNAESAVRNSTLTALGGLVALGVAVAALRQATLARRVHAHQKNIDWSKAFADASKMLSDPDPTARVAAVLTLVSLGSATAITDSELRVRAALASFIRHGRKNDIDSVRLALDYVCEPNVPSGLNLKGAVLADMDLTGLSFQRTQLSGASLRGSTVSASEERFLSTVKDIDLGQVSWV